ncbi:MAG: hypothetical protein RL757_3260 [Bacteroidota bacterium]|jgi:hypothetical protein
MVVAITFYETLLIFYETLLTFYETLLIFCETLLTFYETLLTFYETLLAFYKTLLVFINELVVFYKTLVVFINELVDFYKTLVAFINEFINFYNTFIIKNVPPQYKWLFCLPKRERMPFFEVLLNSIRHLAKDIKDTCTNMLRFAHISASKHGVCIGSDSQTRRNKDLYHATNARHVHTIGQKRHIVVTNVITAQTFSNLIHHFCLKSGTQIANAQANISNIRHRRNIGVV